VGPYNLAGVRKCPSAFQPTGTWDYALPARGYQGREPVFGRFYLNLDLSRYLSKSIDLDRFR
jgi:hypothetical protein